MAVTAPHPIPLWQSADGVPGNRWNELPGAPAGEPASPFNAAVDDGPKEHSCDHPV
jgi:hypothetical protein